MQFTMAIKFHAKEKNMDIILLVLNIAIIVLLVILLLKKSGGRQDNSEIMALLHKNNEEIRDTILRQISSGATEQFQRFDVMGKSLSETLQSNREEINKQLQAFQQTVDNKISAIQKTCIDSNTQLNTSTNATLQTNREEINKQLHALSEQIDSRLSSIQKTNSENNEKMNANIEKRLLSMQNIVDEKLSETLNKRISQSFEQVAKHLESVQQGLGEMKELASDAKSLKNALTNVKERGTYGEIRLEKLLEDILATSQYGVNVEIASGKRVEFVIYLPGKDDGNPLLLPIDSKFPIEDYNRLLAADDKTEIENARKSLAQKIKSFAKDIHDKYILPPKTTDFALMFLPTEGLYAEVVQNVALFEELRDKYKVTPVGVTTLSAFLASLQMGFKTLAIEQRSQEVWNVLGSVKAEFGKFGDMLEKAHKQLQTADNTLSDIVGVRTRKINNALKNVEEFPIAIED
jgi:DNA recombination protein RmuC